VTPKIENAHTNDTALTTATAQPNNATMAIKRQLITEEETTNDIITAAIAEPPATKKRRVVLPPARHRLIEQCRANRKRKLPEVVKQAEAQQAGEKKQHRRSEDRPP
jgi:hypothetical protein